LKSSEDFGTSPLGQLRLGNLLRRASMQKELYVAFWQILLQKSAITVREDCLDLLTRLPTMPLFGER